MNVYITTTVVFNHIPMQWPIATALLLLIILQDHTVTKKLANGAKSVEIFADSTGSKAVK